MNFNIQFTLNEAVTMLQNLGLTVQLVDTPINFSRTHGEPIEEIVTIWMVTNPHTGKNEQVLTFFTRYIQSKKTDVFLNPDKLEIFNLFNK